MAKREPKTYGAICYPGGRKIEITSQYSEWLDWAQNALYEANERECKEHPANIETSMLYRKTQTMGIVSKSRDPMKIGKMSPSMAKALEIVDAKKRGKKTNA